MRVDMVTMHRCQPMARRALHVLQRAGRIVGALADGPPAGRPAGADGAHVERDGGTLRCDHLEHGAVGTSARAAARARATRSAAYADARGAYRLIRLLGEHDEALARRVEAIYEGESDGQPDRLVGPVPQQSSHGHCRCDELYAQGSRVRIAVLCHAAPLADRAEQLLDLALQSDECGVGGGSISRPLRADEESSYLRAQADRIDYLLLAQRAADEEEVLARAGHFWDGDVAYTWMTSPNTRLEGDRPLDRVKAQGVEAVLEALEAETGRASA